MIITGKDLMNELGGTLEQYETIRENGPSKASVEDKDEASDQGQSQSSSQTESSAAGGEG